MADQSIYLYIDTLAFAGTESHILDLASGLRRLGLNAIILCPAASPLLRKAVEREVPVVALPTGKKSEVAVAWTLWRLLHRPNAILHTHNGWTALRGALLARLCPASRCVFTQHFLEPSHVRRRGIKAWASHQVHAWVNGGLHQVIAISEAVRENVLARGEADEDRLTMIPNGVAMADVPEDAAGRVRAELGIAPAAPLIVCVARLEPEKDIKTLLAAMPDVLAQRPDARLVVVGDGVQAEALRSQACALEIDGAVRFTGFRDDARTIIAAADVFTLPSVAEPFGLVLVEAMALGKPVVAVNAGGPTEIVVDGVTGRLVAPQQPAALAQALCELLADPAARQKMGTQGRARYESCYTVERMAQATAQVYQKAFCSKTQ